MREGLPRHTGELQPATIMTDPAMADATYIEPITWQSVEQIIIKSARMPFCPPWVVKRRLTALWPCMITAYWPNTMWS